MAFFFIFIFVMAFRMALEAVFLTLLRTFDPCEMVRR